MSAGSTEHFEPGPLDRPQARWRLALRRLPVTLAVLAVVGGGAAGLAYVASGSGTHRFPAVLRNDLGAGVVVGACEEDDCTPGGFVNGFRVPPGGELTVGLRAGSVVNPMLITTLEAKRIGCLFLRYAKAPPRAPVIRLSEAKSC
jgi:hypothetical protein